MKLSSSEIVGSIKNLLMSSFITLKEGATMTYAYQKGKDNILKTEYQGSNILAVCETFDKSHIQQILDEPNCTELRIYFGFDEKMKIHSILVGVDATGN